MKTSTTHNQYVFANNVLIFIVSMLLGYNIYQEIYHPKNQIFSSVYISGSYFSYGKENTESKRAKKDKAKHQPLFLINPEHCCFGLFLLILCLEYF
jgi:hypothetical protein